VQQGRSHEGTKAAKVEYLGDSGQLLTTGFSKFSDRQLAVWSQDDLTAPLKMENIDCSSGVLNPVYDHDTRMVYVWGKGDGNIRYYEVSSEAPWVSFLSQVISGEPQRGFGVMPKHGVDAGSCELFRFYKLHATKDMVEPISMIVPRKSNMFQQDVFPDTAAPVPALTQDEWIQGEDAAPVMMSMRPGSTLPLIQKKTDWSRVMGDKNNDKKYHFLSKETQPDYRQIHQTSKNSNNNNKDTDNSQYYSSNRNRKPQQDLKTKPNTKYDLTTVKNLTNKFDNINNNNSTTAGDEVKELKNLVKEQATLINSLREQLKAKDQKMKDMESKMRVMMKQNSKIDLSLELNGHSLA